MSVVLNPDAEYVKEIRSRLKANGGYCPCRIEKNADTKCMCKEFRDQMAAHEEGMCHCGMYEYQDKDINRIGE